MKEVLNLHLTSRQQTRHLGINGAQQIEGVNLPAPRERRKSLTPPTRVETTTGSPADDVEILDMQDEDEQHYIKSVRRLGEDTEWASHSQEEQEQEQSEEQLPLGVTPSTSTESIDYGAYVTLIPWELIQQNGKSEKLREMHETLLTKQPPVQQQQEQQQGAQPPPQTHPQSLPHSQSQSQPLYRDEHVRVVIHNLTQISEADVQKWSTNTNGFGTMEEHNYVNLKL